MRAGPAPCRGYGQAPPSVSPPQIPPGGDTEGGAWLAGRLARLDPQLGQAARAGYELALQGAEGLVVGGHAGIEALAEPLQVLGEGGHALVEGLAGGADLLGVLGEGGLPPAEGHGAQQGHEPGRPAGNDLLPHGVLQQGAVLLQGGAQEGLAGQEQHHEVGAARELRPVGLAGQLAHPLAHLAGVAPQGGPLGGLVVGVDGVQVGVQGRLGVHDQLALVGQADDQVRAQALAVVAGGHLLGEVGVGHHAGQLHQPAQGQLAPAAAHAGPAQGLHQVARLVAQGLLGAQQLGQLLVQGAPGLLAGLLQLADLRLGARQGLLQGAHGVAQVLLALLQGGLGAGLLQLEVLLGQAQEEAAVLAQGALGEGGEVAPQLVAGVAKLL